jgi:hypothetical protein
MSAPSDRWHFARPELAEKYLQTFALGLTSARGLFARRRMGKTEFLSKDLLPAAQAHGYVTAYANLWANRDAPGRAIVEVLALTLAPRGARRLLEDLKRPVKSLKASVRVVDVEGGLETELAARKEPTLDALTEVLLRLDRSKKRLLLVLDEAQVLARSEHQNFAHALRAALDVRKDTIKVVFAGSSEATLRRMFGKSSEPFYNWAALEPFELLGDEFVQSMVQRVNGISRYPLALEDARDAFEALNRTPEFFRGYLSDYVQNPQDGSAGALQRTREQVLSDVSFRNQWAALKPADRAVLRALADAPNALHGAENLARIGHDLGLGKPVTMSAVQNSLQRLQREDIVARVSFGEYRFEDEAFQAWVRALPD